LKVRIPAVITVIIEGGVATLVLTLAVTAVLFLTGGAEAILKNAALIGAVLALGGVFTTQLVNSALEAQRTREAALQKYFEQVGKLLIEKPLRRASPGDHLSTVVRAQTLTVLEGLDHDRKRILLLFLYESGLIHKDKQVVPLVRANLSRANLSRANLGGANLVRVNLSRADLRGADLKGADLRGANLKGAHLERALLHGSVLKPLATLGDTDITIHDLRNLTLAEVSEGGPTQERIERAYGDENTQLPPNLKRPAHWGVETDQQTEGD
jgi:uncharacterized protein YjbI with pentapeptide repeats